MTSFEDVRTAALALPEVTEELSDDGRPWYRVRKKMFLVHRSQRPDAVDAETGERLDDVLMFRVADEGVKQALLADPSGAYFTTSHFNGYPAILVRISQLDRLTADEARELVTEAWLCQAPKRLVKTWSESQGTRRG
ncbi:MAG: MmcQ/YjbR family DNA-binding protein [Micromonosporaceae bacterium]